MRNVPRHWLRRHVFQKPTVSQLAQVWRMSRLEFLPAVLGCTLLVAGVFFVLSGESVLRGALAIPAALFFLLLFNALVLCLRGDTRDPDR